jgi:4-amino-4-deoxy-L-arabinose transferase-like glycosyltransferase
MQPASAPCASFMLWIPAGALVVVVCALALIAGGCACARRGRWGPAAVAIAIAAFLVRGYAADDPTLHPFDERYHALVAKHLIDRPLVPVLYADPVLPYNVTDWANNHVWLHKPPLTLWLQAASMSVFGVSELPMRLPSLLWSTASVLATFGIGWLMFSPPIGLAAAAFQAVNGFLVDLASGRRASDHVDTLLIFLVEVTILAALLAEKRKPRWVGIALGVGCGLAWLTKSLAGLFVLPIWFLIRVPYSTRIVLLRQAGVAIPIALTLVMPWTLYAWMVFPVEAQHEADYALRHITEELEGQGGPPWTFIVEMPRYFSELIYLPIILGIASVVRHSAPMARQAMLMWIALPYLVFSLMATKMPAYVMVAAPALFLIQGELWIEVYRRFKARTDTSRTLLLGFALVVLAFLPARHLLNPSGPLESKGDPRWASDLRDLNATIGPGSAVLFNVQTPIEAMFYTPYVAYDFEATATQIAMLSARGYRVYRYEARTAGQPPRLTSLAPDGQQ